MSETPLASPAAILANAWTQPPATSESIATTMLLVGSDIPADELREALLHLARTREWRPNAATIRRAVVDLRGLYPTVAEAGVQARRYSEVRRWYRDGGSIPSLDRPVTGDLVHPVVRDAVDAAGTDSPAAFAKAYREAVDHEIERITAAPLVNPVEYRPVRLATNHRPPELSWAKGGWRTDTGELVTGDRDGQGALAIEAGA